MGYESEVSQSVSKIDQGTAYTSDAPSLRWPWPWPASTHLLPNDIFLYKLADHVKVDFDDVFVEPSAVKEGDIGTVMSTPVRKLLAVVFVYSQTAIYYFCSLVIGLFAALVWGAVIGLFNFAVVWLAQPLLKLFFINLRIFSILFKAVIRSLLDPLFQSVGQSLSSITVRVGGRYVAVDEGRDVSSQDTEHTSHSQDRAKAIWNYAHHQQQSPQEWMGYV